jgi:hypothetical protein
MGKPCLPILVGVVSRVLGPAASKFSKVMVGLYLDPFAPIISLPASTLSQQHRSAIQVPGPIRPHNIIAGAITISLPESAKTRSHRQQKMKQDAERTTNDESHTEVQCRIKCPRACGTLYTPYPCGNQMITLPGFLHIGGSFSWSPDQSESPNTFESPEPRIEPLRGRKSIFHEKP